jgi:hypothetical protein
VNGTEDPEGRSLGATEMIAFAFVAFALLVAAWFVAPSRVEAAE